MAVIQYALLDDTELAAMAAIHRPPHWGRCAVCPPRGPNHDPDEPCDAAQLLGDVRQLRRTLCAVALGARAGEGAE